MPRKTANTRLVGGSSDPKSSYLDRNGVVYSKPPGNRRQYSAPAIGTRFGRLTITRWKYGERGGLLGVYAECDCGEESLVSEANLRFGRTKQCNTCAMLSTRKAQKYYWGYADILPDVAHRTRLLNRISAIITRCENPSASQYRDYGGRGIRVYPEWLEGYTQGKVYGRRKFLAYLLTLEGWDSPFLELDRTDNDKGYEPDNLRFITRRQNCGNRRTVQQLEQRIRDLESRLRRCQCGAATSVHDPNEPGSSNSQ